jgi:hypothetical protein
MEYKFNELEDSKARAAANTATGQFDPAAYTEGRRPMERGRTAVWQARLVMLVMINLAQLWILSATIEAALASHYDKLVPLVVASAVCWAIALTIFLWWKPASRRRTSTGYVHKDRRL